MSSADRLIGIVIGIVIGLVALILFVFGGSSESIDAPSIDQTTPADQPAATTPK
jgi:hypothetical protein